VGTPVATSTGGTGPTATAPTATATPGGVANPCPAGISVVGNAATARLDSGWTGLAHNSKIITGGEASVATDCGGKARPCGVCNLTGPIPNPDANHGTSNNHRCTNNTSIECTDDSACVKKCIGGSADAQACTTAADCSGGLCPAAGTCQFFFGAPLPLAAGGVSTCVISQIVGGITGTANIESGESVSTAHLTSNVFNGILLEQPCPVCDGDATVADGQRGGTCTGGSRDGLTCDVGGSSPEFVAHGNTSFDCPPLAGAKIGGLPILLNNSTSTTTLTLSNNNPDCRGGTGKCFCDTCATAAAEPCSTNADCPGGAICGGRRCQGGNSNGHACTIAGRDAAECGSDSSGQGIPCGIPGQATQSNQCDSGSTCVADSAGSLNGHCSDGPVDQFCSPNEPFRGCATSDQCNAPDTCTLSVPRPCYLDNGALGGSVAALGIADPPVNGVSHPTLASLFCIAPTTSSSVNIAAGLPGLGRLTLPATATEIAAP
jgi:hypothetical protein